MCTVNQVAEHEDSRRYFGALADACLSHSDALIRNKATVLGNICALRALWRHDPSFAALVAVLHVFGREGERDVPFADFITGPRKNVPGPRRDRVAATLRCLGPFRGLLHQARRRTRSILRRSAWLRRDRRREGQEYRLAYGAVRRVGEGFRSEISSPDRRPRTRAS